MSEESVSQWKETGAEVLRSEEHPAGLTEERLLLPGWDPDEPVPAVMWRKRDGEAKPLMIYIHGFSGDKDGVSAWLKSCADAGLCALSIENYFDSALVYLTNLCLVK